MPILTDSDKQEIQKRLAEMVKPVRLIFFTQNLADCQFCRPTEEILTELAILNDKMKLEKYNFVSDKAEAEMYKVDKIPATVIVGENDAGEAMDYGIRFYGIPAGYEFTSLLETILMVSTGKSGLSDKGKEELRKLDKDVHIQVFVTPTCPYCPQAVIGAHRLAFENGFVTSDMVEATEYPQLSNRYAVRTVPKVVINDNAGFEGAIPDELFVQHILNAVANKNAT